MNVTNKMNTLTQRDYTNNGTGLVSPRRIQIQRGQSSWILSYWLNRNVDERSRQRSFELVAYYETPKFQTSKNRK
jgi:hypothetical protein